MLPGLDFETRLQALEKQAREIRGDRGPYDGAWTPTFQGTTIAGVFTYGANTGKYWRVGNIVFAVAQLNITAIGTPPTGNMVIGGLPFSSASTYYYGGVTLGIIDNFNYTAAALALTGRIVPTEAIIRLYEVFDNAGNAAAPAANFTNVNCNMALAAFYFA